MEVQYEIIKGKPTNLRPLTVEEIFNLKVGDKVFLWAAYNDNPSKLLLDGICEVSLRSPEEGTECGWFSMHFKEATGYAAPYGGWIDNHADWLVDYQEVGTVYFYSAEGLEA